MLDPQSSNIPLFRLDNRAAFAYKPIIQILCQKLKTTSISCQAYSDYSFCKKTAQQAFNNGILNRHIQNLV